MAILYRAIWSDSGADLVGRVERAFQSWVGHKSGGELAGGELTSAEAGVRTADGSVHLRWQHESADLPDAQIAAAFRASFVENVDGGARWMTTVRTWEGPGANIDGDPGGWVWVDIDAVTHDSLEYFVVEAPRFVRELLDAGSSPSRPGVRIASVAQAFRGEDGAERLAGIVTDVDRDMPVVVFAPLPETFTFEDLPADTSVADRFADAVQRAAEMSAGLASVCTLDEVGMQAFRESVSEPYTVRDGAFRIYLPGVDPAMDEAWRHRYTVPVRFMGDRDTAGRLINRAISLHAGARRAPNSYEMANRMLEAAKAADPDDLRALIALADEELAQQRTRLDLLDQRYLSSIEDQRQLEEENNRLRTALADANRRLTENGSRNWDGHTERAGRRPPDSAGSPSEAVALAREHLSDHLVIPAEACIDMDDIDNAMEARHWGETSWRAFRALHAYGRALAGKDPAGSFWVWCANSGDPYAWPATPKKLAMSESQSVKNNKTMRARRTFPIDTDVIGAGKVYMDAHIKIAEGGGLLAPRIYFYPYRRNAKVYVGYFGPHKNVPNTLA